MRYIKKRFPLGRRSVAQEVIQLATNKQIHLFLLHYLQIRGLNIPDPPHRRCPDPCSTSPSLHLPLTPLLVCASSTIKMKASTVLFAILPAIVQAGEPGGPKDPDSLSRGPLPLHQLPECWQGCLQSEDRWFPPDINTISVYDFCLDTGLHVRFWSQHSLATCTNSACTKAEAYVSQDWYFDTCHLN